jgi:hypothetical protein
MADRPVRPDAPPGLRLRLLGSEGWLTDRQFYLSDDGSVWCRQASYAPLFPPRWRQVSGEELESVVLHGWTLAQLAATLTAPPEDEPTGRGRRNP